MSLENLATAVCDADLEKTVQLCKTLLGSGIVPKTILVDGLTKGLSILGELWERQDVFLADVLCAVDAFHAGLDLVQPHLEGEVADPLGKIVIGTVAGDIHCIGKNIVAILFTINGFEVTDLGEDVAAERFIDAIESEQADIVAMSCLVSTSLPEMAAVIQGLSDKGLRDKVKVMVGGPPVTLEFVERIGADLYAPDAFEAFKVAKEAVTS